MDNQKQNLKATFIPGAIIGGMEILRKIPTKDRYEIRCLKCNEILNIHEVTLRRRVKHPDEFGCTKCVKQKQYKEQCKHKSGEIVGDYELIKPYTEQRQTGMWHVKCLKCGAELVISYNNAKKRKREGCYFCNPGKGQLVPRKFNKVLSHYKPSVLTRLERYFNATKNKIHSLNLRAEQGTGRKYKDWELTLEEFSELVTQNCKYCGAEPEYRPYYTTKSNPNEKLYAHGLDRVDSSIGYTYSNCVPCCTVCNRMKLDLSVDEFYSHIKKIISFQKCSETIENTENSGSE